MGTELAVRVADVNVDELKQLGALLAHSGYFEKSPNESQAVAQMAVKVMAGREIGLGPFASVQGFHVIQGKLAMAANLMASFVRASARYDYRVRKMDATICEIEFFERTADGKRESLGVSSFNADEARKASVKNMDKFPRNMLFARAMSNGVKWYCPDVFNGNTVYVPEELGATVDGDGNVIDSTASIVTEVTPANGGAQHTNGTGASAATTSDAGGAKRTTDAVGGTGNGTKVIGRVSEGTRKHMWGIGVALYGDQWETKRHELARYISNGRTESSTELYEAEANKLINGMEEKLRASQPQSEPEADPAELAPVTLDEVEEMPF